MSTLKVNTIQNTSAAHSSTPQQIAEGRAKAWCAWDSRGTFAVSDSFNVSSVTDNGQGDFTVNIDTDMSNANYCVVAQCAGNGSPNGSHNLMQIHSSNRNTIVSPSVGSFRCCVLHPANNVNQDTDHIAVAVFGDQ